MNIVGLFINKALWISTTAMLSQFQHTVCTYEVVLLRLGSFKVD